MVRGRRSEGGASREASTANSGVLVNTADGRVFWEKPGGYLRWWPKTPLTACWLA